MDMDWEKCHPPPGTCSTQNAVFKLKMQFGKAKTRIFEVWLMKTLGGFSAEHLQSPVTDFWGKISPNVTLKLYRKGFQKLREGCTRNRWKL